LLLKRAPGPWTELQRSRLPDGIRDSQANVILLEFKYTESLSADALRQTLCYDHFYRQTQRSDDQEMQTVLLLAKQPQSGTLAKFGYIPTTQVGVYHCPYWLLNTIPILSLNELPNEPHNAWVKCFASQQKEKRKAFNLLKQLNIQAFTSELEWFLAGLWQYWFSTKGDKMNQAHLELTPEQVTEMGKFWWPLFQSKLSVEERLAGLSPAEVLGRLKPEERLVGLKPEEVLGRFKPEERLVGLKPEEVLGRFKPEERLVGLKPEERLVGLTIEERLSGLSSAELEAIKVYLQQFNPNNSSSNTH